MHFSVSCLRRLFPADLSLLGSSIQGWDPHVLKWAGSGCAPVPCSPPLHLSLSPLPVVIPHPGHLPPFIHKTFQKAVTAVESW